MRYSSISRLAFLAFEFLTPLTICLPCNAQTPVEGSSNARAVISFANYRDILHSSKNPYVLLQKKEVQKELAIADDAKKKIDDCEKDFKEKISNLLRAMEENKGDLDDPNYKLMRMEILEYRNRSIKNVLSKSQFMRLWQITLQIEGPMALAWPEFSERFRITEFQTQQILEITQECDNKLAAVNWDTQAAYNKMQNKLDLDDKSKKFENQMSASLAENKKQFADMFSKKSGIYDAANKKALKHVNSMQVRSINRFIGEKIDIDEYASAGSATSNSEASKIFKKQ